MKTVDFCIKYAPCRDGRKFALQFETMNEVWQACLRPDWLFWILEKHSPLEKEQSVRLSIAFAESCLCNVPKGEDRPRLAVEAAKAWLANPCEETASAAESSARSAAESAARSAAESAAESSQCDQIREAIPNPFEK